LRKATFEESEREGTRRRRIIIKEHNILLQNAFMRREGYPFLLGILSVSSHKKNSYQLKIFLEL